MDKLNGYKINISKNNKLKLCAFSEGVSLEDAIAHYDFWKAEGDRIASNYTVTDWKVSYEVLYYPFNLEDAMRKAMANKIPAIHAILQSNLDDQDKEDLIRSVVNDAPWDLAALDTLVRDRFCTIMEEIKP